MGRTRSFWMDTVELPARARLEGDARAEVCVVGAGIAGLSVAYELARSGRDVLVVDKDQPGAGETGRTTAHLANAMDDRFARLERLHGEAGSRGAASSHGAAIDRIESIAGEERIECGFRRVDAYLFLAPEDDPSLLEEEAAAAERAGLRPERLARATTAPFDTGPCLRFPDQAQFHPLRYLAGLAAAVERWGGRIHDETRVVDAEDGEPCRVELWGGGIVTCDDVVLATNSPSRHYLTTAKMLPYRTFAVALRAPAGLEPSLWWDTGDPYHYVRLAGPAEQRVLIVGGGDYQTGTKDEGRDRFAALEAWARERFADAGAVVERWSGQVLEPADALAFIGRAPGADHVWLCTGDSGQGITHGALAGIILGDLIQGRENRWSELYSPSRVRAGAAKDYAAEGVKIGRGYLDWLLPGEVEDEVYVPAGHGAIIRKGVRPLAVYRDDEGRLHRRSAVCTHMGCIVHWNSTEGSWDCPCHGSRFGPDGGVLNGPAARELGPVE